MRAGQLRNEVVIKTLTVTKSTVTGELTESYTPLATVWAWIRPMAGREKWYPEQIQSRVDTFITIRYLDGVSVKGIVSHGSTDYLIESIINIEERNVELQLQCYKVLI